MDEDLAQQPPRTRRVQDERYTRVAIYLHWAIAALIVCNLLSGFMVWDFASWFFRAPENRAWYFFGLTLHLSAGITVLALTVVRIAWRLMHAPPAYPPDMKSWEKHASHFAHFFLYAAMLLMPLTGWGIISANPPAGSAGAAARQAQMAAAASPAPERRGPPPGSGPARDPLRIWWVLTSLPAIAPLQNLGAEPEGLKSQLILHDEIADWHQIGAWLTLLLLLLHVAGALKHQWIDRHPALERMGWGKRRSSSS